MQALNSDINIIGSIPDYHLIFKSMGLYALSPHALENSVIENNEFNFRTIKSRKRFVSSLYSAFLNFKNKKHQAIIEKQFKAELTLLTKQLILFWQFSFSNKLFFELNKNVFIKNYYSGRISLSKEDVVAYIKELLVQEEYSKAQWSNLTITTMASKYLTILKKLDLMEGSVKKTFKHIQISNEALIVFIELALSLEPELSDFFKSKYFSLLFISKETFLERAKELAIKNYIELSYNGKTLKLELKNPINKGV